ncbi:acyl carrier protein, partial [Frankia casuarinae]
MDPRGTRPDAGTRPDDDARHVWLATAGRLWTSGVSLDWSALHAGQGHRRVPLPTYPFQRRRYWVEADEHAFPATAGGTDAGPAPAEGTLRDRVETARDAERPALVIDFIQHQVAEMLGLDDAAQVDPDQNLFTLGLDSLNLIEIAARLGAELEQDVRASVFTDHPTIRAYVEKLAAS